MKKYVLIPDLHAPFEDKYALGAALEYTAFYHPDAIIQLGDAGHFESVSHWIKDKRLKLEGLRIEKDIKATIRVLDLISSAAPKAERVITLGNHEKWVNSYIEEHPEIEGLLDLNREYHNAGWKVVDINKPYQIGKLLTFHGLFISKYHAYQTVHAFSKSCAYAHTHDRQEYTESFYDGEKSAQSLGCLCHDNPDYLKNRPNKWSNGMATVDVDSVNGDFFIDSIKIVRGRFSRNGRIFKG